MILLDTHIWLWWASDYLHLRSNHLTAIQNAPQILISAISCWEIAKLVELKRLSLTIEVLEWLNTALQYPNVQLVPLSPEIVVESTRLPGNFHKDPADQIIVATARFFNCPIITEEVKISGYPHVLKI